MSRELIYVLDNGYEYSDHEIAFVKTAWPREVVETAMRFWGADYRDERPRIIGVVEEVLWWEGGFLPLEKLVDGWKLQSPHRQDKIDRLPLEFLESVLALEEDSHWKPKVAKAVLASCERRALVTPTEPTP